MAKHKVTISLLLLAMFVITQFIGLLVLHADPLNLQVEVNGTVQDVPNPQLSFIQPPEGMSPASVFLNFVSAFVLAIFLIFLLMKFKVEFFLRLWFFAIVVFALWIVVYAFEILVPWVIGPDLALIIPLIIALPLAFFKVYKRNILVHNFTELFIYPGIAVIFVSFLAQWSAIANLIIAIAVLVLISIYDMWAVWHSGIMQKMAKYQMEQVKVFGGFFIPHMTDKVKKQIKKLKEQNKAKKAKGKKPKTKSIKVNLAILGGGDVVFPLIAAGIMFKSFSLASAILVIAGATLGLAYLLVFSEKKKFYPAMPFITAGVLLGMLVSWIITLF
jgi:presenilin-like A22 family membrane protease